MSDDCIFCRIIDGTLPSFKLYEDAKTLAIMDINPASPGHALVLPKEHGQAIFDISADAVAAVSATAQKIAKAADIALNPAGITVLQANGPGAAQSVPHYHVHVIPRTLEDGLPMNWLLTPGDRNQIRELAEKIKAAL